jgi:outer membrane immunogenic protein
LLPGQIGYENGLTQRHFLQRIGAMKQLVRLTILFSACAAMMTAFAGTEAYSGKEMKQVAPAPPPECNWTGFYIGLNVGGQWGHSESDDLDFYWTHGSNGDAQKWGWSESGVVAGGQVGYNFQWNWLVLGAEADLGYMNLDGSGIEPWSNFPPDGPNVGSSDSDFFTTIRGRLGFAFGHWLFYGTGGGIGVNYETKVDDAGEFVHFHKQDFDWGWTGGGGIEYMLNCHWSLRGEYLRYDLDKQRFSGVWATGAPGFGTGLRYRFDGNTEGNIIRAGLNYKF